MLRETADVTVDPEAARAALREPLRAVCTVFMGRGFLAVLFCAGACAAQTYEVGANFGFGAYRSVRTGAPGAQADAGIGSRYTAGFLIGEDLYDHLSGEARYLFQSGDPFVSAGGVKTSIQGQSHTMTYDLVIHIKGEEHKLRPFAAVGAGMKYYRGFGVEPRPQPLSGVASVVHTDHWRFVADVGFGVKYQIRPRLLLRAEFRDYITPFPRKLIVPAAAGSDPGRLQMFTPMVGISYLFLGR